MGSKGLLCLALLLTLSSAINGYNITRLLGQYPDLGLFNQYITESNLGGAINSRGTITVLGVDNGSLSSISGRSKDTIKAIISTHIILDYYDERKLMNIKNDSTTLTTLYQSSGIATRNQGFISVYNAGGGEFYFGSAVKGAPLNSKFVKTVVTQPYNVSVLQVSQPIIPPGIDAQSPWPAPGAQTPLPPKKAEDSPPSPPAPAPSDDDAADAPAADGSDAEAPSPSRSKATASTPTPAPAPGPGSSDDTPADDESNEDSTSTPSSSTRVQMGLVGTAIAVASLLVTL